MLLGRFEAGDLIAGTLALVLLWALAYGSPQATAPEPTHPASVISRGLLDATGDQLAGRALFDANRRDLGTVEFIARSSADGRLYAVVSPRGAVERSAIVGLDRIEPDGGRLTLSAPAAGAAPLLEYPAMPEQLDPVQADLRIGQLEGVEGSAQPGGGTRARTAEAAGPVFGPAMPEFSAFEAPRPGADRPL